MDVLNQLIADFNSSNAWAELGVLAACLGLAYLVCFRVGRGHAPNSVWFGRNTVDGVLFPVLALVLVFVARVVMARYYPVFVLNIAVPIFLSLAVIRMFARVLTLAFPNSGAIRILEQVVSWFAWIAAVLWILDLLPLVMKELDAINLTFGRTHVSLLTVIEGAISSLLVLVAALWISSAVEHRVLRESVQDLSVRKLTVNVMRAVLLFVGLLFALSAVGVDLTALSVMGGAIGVGLGFGLQKLASNYVSGFVMLLERSLRIGDNVRVDGFEGRIADITTRYTLIRANNGREAIVPNETFITQRVENLSIQDQKFNMTSNIVVGYDSNVAQVQAILVAAATAQPRVLADPAPVAFLVNFAPDGIEFSLNFWINDPEAGQGGLKSAVNIAMLEGLRAAAIAIPFPQRVLHVQRGAEPSPVAAPESQA